MDKETIYISITSSLIHAFFLVLALYIVNKKFIIEFFIKKYANSFSYFIKFYIRTTINKYFEQIVKVAKLTNDPKLIKQINKFRDKIEDSIINQVKKTLTKNKDDMVNTIEIDEEKVKRDAENNENKYKIARGFIIGFGVALVIFLVGFYILYKDSINSYNAFMEILISFILTVVILFGYQVFFIFGFIFNYIDYKVPTILKNMLIIKKE